MIDGSKVKDLACAVHAVVDERVTHRQVLTHDKFDGLLRSDPTEERANTVQLGSAVPQQLFQIALVNLFLLH